MSFDFGKIESPEWAQTAGQTGIVYEAGGSLQYRFDGLKGEFWLGSETVGKLLKIRPFDWRWDAGERWSRPSQSWFDIAFLDVQGIVSVLSLNNRSAINVYADLSRLVKAGKLPTAHAITLGVSEATVTKIDDGGDYEDSFQVVRVIGCEVVTQSEFEELREFAATDVFDWHITGEVD